MTEKPAVTGNNNFRFYEFGEFKLDTRRRILLKNDAPVQVSARIFDLLLVFVQNEGRVLGHEELLDKVWGGTFVEQSNLKKSVSTLRQVLGEASNESLYVKTVPRRGYCFVAPVRGLPDEDSGLFYLKGTDEEIFIEENISANKIADEEISANPPEPKLVAEPETKTFWQARKTQILAIGAGLLIFVVVFGAWRVWRGQVSAESFRLENLKIQKLTTSGNVQRAAISPDGKIVVYAIFDTVGRQSLWAKRIGQPNALQINAPAEVQYEAITVSPDSNFVYYSVSAKQVEDSLFRLPISGGGTPRKITESLSSNATFSPDGKRLAFVRDTPDKMRRLLTVNAETGGDEREIYAVADNHQLIEPVWSPDGQKFAFVSSDVTETGRTWTLSEIPAGGGAVKPIFAPQKEKVFMGNWLRDGSGLIICAEPTDSRQTQLWRVAYPGGEITRLTNDVSSYGDVTLSDDGNALLSIQSEKTGDLWTMNWTMLQNTTRLTETQNFVGVFAVFPDGKILGETLENGQFGFQTFNADGGNPQPLFSQISNERTPSVMPDGKTILFTSRRSGTQEIWKANADGRNAQKLTDEKTFIIHPLLSPDGKEIFFLFYDGAIWRLAKMPADGGAITFLADEFVNVFSLSPDGKSIAYSYRDERKKRLMTAIRNVADNQLQKQFEIAPLTLIQWTPDGTNLIYNSSETFRDGGSLWMQPIDGSTPKPLLETKDDRVYWAAWSPDKQKLYMTRGKTNSNIVLLTKTNQ